MVPPMRLTVIGSSDAFNSAGRFHSCYWLDGIGDASLMVDFGSTALGALRRHGKDPHSLGGVAITHLHGDHIGGLPHLIINAMFNEVRSEPLPIIGPALLEERVTAYFDVAYPQLSKRPKPYALSLTELLPGERAGFAGATIEAFPAQHMDPPDRPLCLRITGREGQVVAFSGDTEFCPGLFAAADGADLLVAECTAMRPPAGRHCTWVEWIERFSDVGARRILLTHLNAEMRASADRLLAEVPPGVDVAFAEDGLVVTVGEDA